MKVVICTSVLKNGSKTRGVGAYTRELLSVLRKTYPKDRFIEVSGNPYTVSSDLVHYPFFDPFFQTLPWRYKQKTVITIHDLIPLKYPAHFKAGIKGRLKWYMQKYRAKYASAIITDSHSSAKDIENLMDIHKDAIHVVPLASATARTPLSMTAKVRKIYKLPEQFILYVGDINWNKNVVGLIEAFSQLKTSTEHLVLVGKVFSDKPDIPEFRAVTKAIEVSPKKDHIHVLGYIPSHHLGGIYRAATLYCQPSFDEGFGLPLLEAMKAGCPVLSSKRGSLPEVGGDAVAYFDPGKNELTSVLQSLLNSASKRTALSMKGLEQVEKFSWEQTAKLTMAVYQSI
jgi:glycosyltransferase involved in cell wall biosynthesis